MFQIGNSITGGPAGMGFPRGVCSPVQPPAASDVTTPPASGSMNPRLLVLALLAVILIGSAAWFNMTGGDAIDRSPALTAAELEALPATVEGDLRMMEEVRRRCGREPGDWRKLPSTAQAVYVTLWAEEIQRTLTWAQWAAMGMPDEGEPTFDEIATGYEQLGCPAAASPIRALAAPFAATASAYQAWAQERRAGNKVPQPATAGLDAAARTAFGRLAEVRPRRLEFARGNAAAWGIR